MRRSGWIRQRRTMLRLVFLPGRGQFHQAVNVFLQIHVATDGNHRVDAVVPLQPADFRAVDEATVYQQHLHHAGTHGVQEGVQERPRALSLPNSFSRKTRTPATTNRSPAASQCKSSTAL